MRYALLALFLATNAMAEPVLIDDFSDEANARWRYVSDQVMGGVSEGNAQIANGAVTLRGTVSTENRGGFIQARRAVDGLPPGMTELHLRVRGNGEQYFVHLRTTGTVLPWQYYQAPFFAGREWSDVTIPLAAFKPSHAILRRTPRPEAIRSIGLVAYGRDHTAEVSMARISAQ